MPLQAPFRKMMTSTVGFEPYVSQDKFGQPVYGSKLLYWARVEYRTRQITDTTGRQVVSMSKVSMDPTTQDGLTSLINPTVRGRITLPNGLTPLILSIGTSNDLVGVHHYVFYC